MAVAVIAGTLCAGPVQVLGPGGRIEFLLSVGDRLQYTVKFDGRPVTDPSLISFSLDGRDLTRSARICSVEYERACETFCYRGVHSKVEACYNGARIGLTCGAGTSALEVRVFADGVAFRHMAAGSGQAARVPDEQTQFILPAGSLVWYHGLGGHYEGEYDCSRIDQIPEGTFLAPPVTVELPEGLGYAAICEANLVGYSGMALRAEGDRVLRLVLAHAHPISYPYELRYTKQDIEAVSRPASIMGTVTTPWRVIMVAADLDRLVNCDMIPSLCPPPDPYLFPEGIKTSWIRPGRAVWRYLDGGDTTLEGARQFSRLAGELGFEYNIIEGYWSEWTDQQIRDLVEYSARYGVGLWVWRHSRQLRDSRSRREFFQRLQTLGIKGAKIDFFDHEHKDVIDLYHALLEESARYHIMVNFHGANKPTGEARTWPNELTREAVRGMEARRMRDRARHDTILPFTRYLAGHADYTPVHLGDRKANTTCAHQVATAVVFTSPLLTYAAHPQRLLDNPAVQFIKAIPATWDQTIVLPVSRIGRLAAFARRSGQDWFVGVLNGAGPEKINVDLGFLPDGSYEALAVADGAGDPAQVQVVGFSVTAGGSLDLDLAAGGGYVAVFRMR